LKKHIFFAFIPRLKSGAFCKSLGKFRAITIEETAKINEEKCMGCGLCAVTCPNEAITMKRLEREIIPSPKK